MTATTFLNGRVTLHAGDCLDRIKDIADASIDAVCTDPPYALVSITKRFGKQGAAPCIVPEGKSGAYARASSGFMGKAWDVGDRAFAVEFWAEVYRVLKPGGHVLAFGGTRTVHRLTCAIEDAGFEIRDMVAWLYGSGFPKSHDVSKGIDKAAGAEREVTGRSPFDSRKPNGSAGINSVGLNAGAGGGFLTAPTTEAARQWEGWGTALKPALEPITVARKPLDGTVAANVLAHGTGALNIAGCRVGTEAVEIHGYNGNYFSQSYKDAGTQPSLAEYKTVSGRWPANLIHDGSDEVVAAFPQTTSNNGNGSWSNKPQGVTSWGFKPTHDVPEGRGDTGSAARFFYQVKPDCRCELCDALIAEVSSKSAGTPSASSALGSAAASRPHESAGTGRLNISCVSVVEPALLDSRPPSAGSAQLNATGPLYEKAVQSVSAAASLCGSCATAIAHVLVEARQTGQLAPLPSSLSISASKRTILSRSLASYVEGRANTDTILTTTNLCTLFGCVFHAIGENTNSARAEAKASSGQDLKRLWYSSKADSDDRIGSKHPTVKPVDLLRYLVRLVTPPGGTVLDPFAGTGTTGEAAFYEGFNAVLIEREDEYRADIARRMALVLAGPDERKRTIIKTKAKPDNFAGTLFAEAAE